MSQAMENTDVFDLTSAVFKANPYPTFARLRLDDPVYLLSSTEEQQTWLLTRYQEAELILHDERFAKSRYTALQLEKPPAHSPRAIDLVTMGMGKFDPPDHTRLRSLVSQSFTPRLVEKWRKHAQESTDALIDAIKDKGTADLVEDFAFPLTLTLILNVLGIDTEDMPLMHRWIRMIVEALGDPVAIQRVNPELEACHSYLLSLIERRRQTPADDLISSLIGAEAKGDRLSESELVAMIFLLIMAGYQTTGTMISNGMLALLMYPEQLALLQSNPALVKTAVEEFLRYRSPLMLATMRWACTDITLGGKLIHRGDQVVISLAAANHDESIFADSDGLDITRVDNHHLAFGKGIHYCLGAPLARLEGQIAISTLLRRLPNLHLQVDPADLLWRPGSMVLGLMQLPVTF